MRKRGKPGRPPTHAAYSLIVRDKRLRDHPLLRQYLQDCRSGLIRDLAGDEEGLTTGQAILVDRAIAKLAILRLLEEYCRAEGIFENGKLLPVLQDNFLAWSNSLRLDLQALGIDKRAAEKVFTPLEYIRAIDQQKQEKEGHK